MEQIPRVLPWAFVFWPFFLHFVLKACKLERRPSVCCEQGEWGVLTSCYLYLSIMFCQILNPAASNMRIYYPINKEEPTPALPKGGSLNEAQYSLTSNRLTSNGHYPPSLGVIDGVASLVEERLRVGELCSGNRRSRFACRRMGLGVGPRLRRIAYPSEQKKALHQTVQGKR